MSTNVPAQKEKKQKEKKQKEKKEKKPQILTRLVVIGSICVIIPMGFFFYKFHSYNLSDTQSDWGTFGDYFGGLLNPLISVLTLIVTYYIAITFNAYEKRRDAADKSEADIKSFLELYQHFTTPEFTNIRTTAWKVLKRAVENEVYARHLVRENYVERYTDRSNQYKVAYENFKGYYPECNDKDAFIKAEAEDRSKLDSFIIFLHLVAIKEVPVYYYQMCDFYYDTWRPMLGWYAIQLEVGYKNSPDNAKYNNPPSVRMLVDTLDKKYYNPEVVEPQPIAQIEEHPIIKEFIQNRIINKKIIK